jgi:hypothetical protein
MTTGNAIADANAAAELILATPPTGAEWAARPGELIPAALRVARAWHADRNESRRLADEFAHPGTLKHFLLSRGFMPDDEKAAAAILDGLIRENERLRAKCGED